MLWLRSTDKNVKVEISIPDSLFSTYEEEIALFFCYQIVEKIALSSKVQETLQKIIDDLKIRIETAMEEGMKDVVEKRKRELTQWENFKKALDTFYVT